MYEKPKIDNSINLFSGFEALFVRGTTAISAPARIPLKIRDNDDRKRLQGDFKAVGTDIKMAMTRLDEELKA